MNIDPAEAPTFASPQESPSLRARITSSEAPPPNEPDHHLNSNLHTELDDIQSVSLPRLADEDETEEGFGCPCEDRPPSLPPSSSPPQLFSSSPYTSSQSSTGDVEPLKMVRVTYL